MSEPLYLTAEDGPFSVPHSYVLGPNELVQLQSVTVVWDGTGASGTFWPALSVYSQDGKLLGRYIPLSSVTAGDQAEVTYGPF